MSHASDDEFMEKLEDEFGLEGYARWWKLLEAIATQMDKSNKCSVSYSWTKWQTILKGKRNKLRTFLERLENESKINLKENGNVLEISCPNLLKFRDEYSKKSGQTTSTTPDKVRSKIQNTETESDTKKESKNKFSDEDLNTSEFIFSKILKLNPNNKKPNFDKWSNDIRLMVERDGKTHTDIMELFVWANNDKFWKANILSPAKLREKWDKLMINKNNSTEQSTTNRLGDFPSD